MADADDVALRELPSLHWRAVHRGAVGRTEISEHRILPVPGDFQVAPGDTRVREAEVGFLPTSYDVSTLLEVVRAVGTVVEVQRRVELTVLPAASPTSSPTR